MRRPTNHIDLKTIARRIDVDNRIALRNYYRTANSLLRQAAIYRSEKNVIDLYAILLRFSSLVSETIPFHRDYNTLLPREKKIYREKLLAVVDELESLKPEFIRQLDELNKASAEREPYGLVSYGPETSFSDSHSYENGLSGPVAKQVLVKHILRGLQLDEKLSPLSLE